MKKDQYMIPLLIFNIIIYIIPNLIPGNTVYEGFITSLNISFKHLLSICTFQSAYVQKSYLNK